MSQNYIIFDGQANKVNSLDKNYAENQYKKVIEGCYIYLEKIKRRIKLVKKVTYRRLHKEEPKAEPVMEKLEKEVIEEIIEEPKKEGKKKNGRKFII